MGGYERDPAPWSLDGIPADFNGRAARRGLAALRAAAGERDRARARARGDGRRAAHQRPGGVHARQRVHPRPDRRARVLGRRRLLRARARGRGRDGQARRRVDPRRRAEPRRVGDGLAPLRHRVPQPRVHARAHDRGVLDLLRRQVPGPRAAGRTAAPHSRRPTRGSSSSAPRSARSPAGSAPNWFEPNAARRRRVAAAARLGRPALVAGDRRRALATAARRAALFDETTLREDRGRRAQARRRSSSACATTEVARDVGAITYTSMLNTRGGIECDFTVTRLEPRSASGSSPAPRSATTTSPGSAQHAPEDGSVRGRGRHVALRLPRYLGAARRARSCSRSRPPTSRTRRSRYMRAREIDVGAGAVPRAPGHLRRRARLGALLPDGVRPAPVGHDLGRGPRRTASSPAATRRSTRCRLEKGYRVWGADITPDDTPYEAGLGFAVKLDKGDFIGREALRRGAGAASAGSPASSSTIRASVALGSEPVRIDGEIVGRVTSGGYGYTVDRSIAYAYVPAGDAAAGPARSRSRSSASGSPARSRPSRLYDPSGERIRS